ncbi:uncharacterized protein MAM_02340 [Metarhizium album ARSEF 1941]|uniref:Protein ECM13 n=1 Tax=Metarhizium album (strain ARSEF 1941) TaxID=1081103 RepID=A0A0B2X1D4_METAS|nr:uncharacterized protein MAM_02340 [Metarhizium album ARSEF 1941]KHN99487.1 hypothetical protein MAM_02340 [Metarhizium album ARSEF 1941]
MPTAAVSQPQLPNLAPTYYSRVPSASRKTMSITQTYYLAHKARAKLSREAAQPDHDLRLLVGHANLLDSLMLELADAEREQERWFNQSVRGASSNNTKAGERRVQWADRVVEESDSSDSDSDSDSDFDEDDVEMANAVSVRVPVAAQQAQLVDEDDDLEEDYAHLELVRTPSHSNSPPELVDHDSESSDDESMPPSPADASLPYNEKEAAKEGEEAIFNDEYYVPQQPSAGLVTAISVY